MIDFQKIIKDEKYVPDNEYGEYWIKFDKLGIKAKKLEFLQTYDFIDGNDDFKNKNYDRFVEMLEEFYVNAYGGKNNIKRIHYIEEPLDEYLQMEYYTYLIDEKYSQEIRVTKDRSLFPKRVYDFVLFENGNLFVLDFGNNDSWNGAWHITNAEKIKEVESWFDKVFEQSENFKSILKPNKYIIKKLKKLGAIL